MCWTEKPFKDHAVEKYINCMGLNAGTSNLVTSFDSALGCPRVNIKYIYIIFTRLN
jgi:hypothetical protein